MSPRRPFARLLLASVVALAQGLVERPAAPDMPAPAAPSAATSGAADRVPELEVAVRTIVRESILKEATIGIAILDVDTGKLLAAHNEHVLLNPASNAKIYTAAAALATLHGDHRYETTLSGNLKRDGVAGPLVLRGHGDPSLTTGDLAAMVQELKAWGITHVDGDILVDQLFFDDQSTPPAFEQQPNEWAAFRAPVSAVALNENCLTLTLRPRGGSAVATFDPPGFVDSDGSVSVAEEGADNVDLTLSGNGKRMSAHLSGSISQESRVLRYTRRVEDPALLAGYALKALLEKADIKLNGDVKEGTAKGKLLARHQSEPLSTLLYALGKNSDNFYAEMIFKTLGGEAKGRPAKSANGGEVVTNWLSQVGANDTGIVIKNGSGLFDANRVTVASAAQLLRVAWRDPSLQPEFVAQLAIGGVDGTLHKRFRSERARRSVRAKTGTLDDTIALSGYVLGPPGRGPIAFSMLFNHVTGHQDGARAAADKLVELLARRQWK
jgi:D-alanyl-D-alanine carboxypeptidase/D-alanyl-D-alanine-endopeptidase (penicillin-binding protein 4)